MRESPRVCFNFTWYASPVQDAYLRYPIRGEKFSYSIQIREHLLSRKTKFQQIEIYDTDVFGKILTLDGHVQLSSFDEAAYHECLVHIPLMSIEQPRRALVVGGGDGGVLRELCRWQELDTIDMVEIDAGVITACREALPELSDGAFDDPRVQVHIEDAFGFLGQVRLPYDFIVMDITDTYEGEEGALSESLFTDKFHLDVKKALGEGGFLVMQADNHVFCPTTMEDTLSALGTHFGQTGMYQAIIPSFGGFSGYCWASHGKGISSHWPSGNGLEFTYLNELAYALAFRPFSFG